MDYYSTRYSVSIIPSNKTPYLESFIFLLRECDGGKEVEPEIERIVKIETKYDTIVETVETYIPEYRTKVKWKTVHDTIEVHDTVPVDTLSILKDYFETYAYTDTLYGKLKRRQKEITIIHG